MNDIETPQPTRTDIDLIDYTVESWPPHFGYRVKVPVTVELPTEIVADCRQEFEQDKTHGRDPEFEEYLWDVVEFEPTFTVEGVVVDTETGLPVDD